MFWVFEQALCSRSHSERLNHVADHLMSHKAMSNMPIALVETVVLSQQEMSGQGIRSFSHFVLIDDFRGRTDFALPTFLDCEQFHEPSPASCRCLNPFQNLVRLSVKSNSQSAEVALSERRV